MSAIYLPPSPIGATQAWIHAYAEKCRLEARIESGFDLDDLFSCNGGRTQSVGAYSDAPNGLLVEPDGTFTIYLSSLRSALSNHRIAAIEFGHHCMHWSKLQESNPGAGMAVPRPVDSDDLSLTRCRWEAGYFAEAFLMPEQGFREAYEKGGFEEVTARFAVTRGWAEARAKSLEILEADPEESLTP